MVGKSLTNDPLGVYISIPFCKAKCTYCNFASDVFGMERLQAYVDQVCGEIRSVRTRSNQIGAALPQAVDTIFFGGGTPSLLSAAQVRQIFEALHAQFCVAPDAEITLECAPGQLAEESFEELQRHGLNRISLGVQSFSDAESRAVGRLHTRASCLAEIDRLRTAGIPNLNIDLIVGLPHQTATSYRESVELAIASGVPHISMYMLEVDDGSRLGRELLAEGSRYSADTVPSDDVTADWCGLACDWLATAGVYQYEISNFARDGFGSRHNLKYWQRQPYIGFGVDAHSMLRTASGAVRFANTSELDRYLQPVGLDSQENKLDSSAFKFMSSPPKQEPILEVIGPDQAFEESLFLGLRLNEGVDLNGLRREFGESRLDALADALREVEEAGLLERNAVSVRLTARGRIASNEVFGRLLSVPAHVAATD
jgi:oxygen-independent coproporphyrinogen III oxidase